MVFLWWHYLTLSCKPRLSSFPQKALDFVMNEKFKFLVSPAPAPTSFLLRALSGQEPVGKHNLASYLLLWKSDLNSRFSVIRHTRNLDCRLWSTLGLSAFTCMLPCRAQTSLELKELCFVIHNFRSIICISFYIFCTSQGTFISMWRGGCHQIEKTGKAERGLAGESNKWLLLWCCDVQVQEASSES